MSTNPMSPTLTILSESAVVAAARARGGVDVVSSLCSCLDCPVLLPIGPTGSHHFQPQHSPTRSGRPRTVHHAEWQAVWTDAVVTGPLLLIEVEYHPNPAEDRLVLPDAAVEVAATLAACSH